MSVASEPDTGRYELLDSGEGRRLENLGGCVVDRQAPAAFWRRRLPDGRWREVHARHHRSEKGGGSWERLRPHPEAWPVRVGPLRLHARLTPFGHVGFFAEQAAQWEWLEAAARRATTAREPGAGAPRVLNLFAYSGGSSLALARGGCQVTHVDAARGMVDLARRNAGLNGLQDSPIRWIVEDCALFLKRELKRGRRYEGAVLDPPTYGRGPKKELFTIEEHLPGLLDDLHELCGGSPALFLLSAHTPGFTPLALQNLLRERYGEGPRYERGEMTIRAKDGYELPSGNFCRFAAED